MFVTDWSAVTFDQYVAGRLRALLRTARAVCGDPVLAEDLVQDVLVKAQSRWELVAAANNPDAYLRRMLVNEYLSWRRKWARVVPLASIEPGVSEPDHADGVADRDALRRRLAHLPRRQQVVLALRYQDGLSDEAIAAAMGCTAGTVRGYASRALATLREQMTTTPVEFEGRVT